jgi:hypothetical protein
MTSTLPPGEVTVHPLAEMFPVVDLHPTRDAAVKSNVNIMFLDMAQLIARTFIL